VLGGRNFGSGSSREHAPMALRYAGVRVVMALSFARIFYRNAVDGGHLIPVIVTEEAYRGIGDGDEVEVDLESSIVRDLTAGAEYPVEEVPEADSQDSAGRRDLQRRGPVLARGLGPERRTRDPRRSSSSSTAASIASSIAPSRPAPSYSSRSSSGELLVAGWRPPLRGSSPGRA
jgi:3-isopropylmalate dehydratase, small subunit (EC 4.2.1.33)